MRIKFKIPMLSLLKIPRLYVLFLYENGFLSGEEFDNYCELRMVRFMWGVKDEN